MSTNNDNINNGHCGLIPPTPTSSPITTPITERPRKYMLNYRYYKDVPRGTNYDDLRPSRITPTNPHHCALNTVQPAKK